MFIYDRVATVARKSARVMLENTNIDNVNDAVI